MKYHIAAFVAGYVLDLLLGDPYWLPHPIRLIGWLITKLEKQLYRGKNLIRQGMILTMLVLLLTAAVSGILLIGAYVLHPVCGMLVESIMTYQILATKCLKVESMKVYNRLQNGTLEEARTAVSMIVGRDTAVLDEAGVTKAAIETVAENTSDGVIAPMLYLAVGGPVLGFLYKSVNTMDSMIGYKNDRYLYFGRTAARLDDVANFIPARISAWLMIAAAFLLGKNFNGKNAYRIYRRDNRNHASPNSAQTEAACAGALGIRLAGDASYFGKIVKKPYIGDDCRMVESTDIKRANQLLYVTAGLCEGICIVLLLCAGYWL
ncbi:MAG: adenosylcobinamide-phosphate synthase CbiB [Lachnospiraceae bacterium]|nr:adenosylcobinamide-phosphate synthase CbiB [Lachnospiraceae bacterium]